MPWMGSSTSPLPSSRYATRSPCRSRNFSSFMVGLSALLAGNLTMPETSSNVNAASASAFRQPLRIEDQDALALDPDPAALAEVGERLVHGLARRPDQLGDLFL